MQLLEEEIMEGVNILDKEVKESKIDNNNQYIFHA